MIFVTGGPGNSCSHTLARLNEAQRFAVNLSTRVCDLVRAFERVRSRPVPYELVLRQAGDIACCYIDPPFATELLNWRAERDMDAICVDTWRWQSNNSNGFRKK
jgi:UDP-glucose 4-epimerase